MESILLLLGSPNDDKGNLSRIALERIDCAYAIFKSNDNVKILCTGGFGEHFNTTGIPHARYAKDELMKRGVHENAFLPFALSSNTYEDFVRSKSIIEEVSPGLLIIVTSDFHIERAGLLQKMIIDYPKVIFIPAKSGLSENELKPLLEHEKNAIKRLHTNLECK